MCVDVSLLGAGQPAVMATGRTSLRARDRTLPLGERTYVMAILNLTDNSFSGDGTGCDVDAAVRHAVAVAVDGADIVDVGAESARADVPVRDAAEEADVLSEAIRRIAGEIDIAISADTYKPAVAEAALQAGARIINDIAGFMEGIGTAEVAARYDAALVINYTYERPKVRPEAPPAYGDLIGAHLEFLKSRVDMAVRAGVGQESLVIDPGIAFGKSHDEDLEVLRRLGEFRALGLPLLVAASRKHFIGSVTGLRPGERDAATAAVTALAIAGGADIVRVHDVRANVAAARITDAIVRGKPGDFAATAASWPWWGEAEQLPGTTIER
jgi:dihydropteroate synthase